MNLVQSKYCYNEHFLFLIVVAVDVDFILFTCDMRRLALQTYNECGHFIKFPYTLNVFAK